MTEINHRNPELRAKLAHLNCFHWLYDIYNNIDFNILYRFVIVNLNDLAQYPDVHLKYIAKELNLVIPNNYNYSFIRKDVNSKRIDEYKREYL